MRPLHELAAIVATALAVESVVVIAIVVAITSILASLAGTIQ